MVAAEHFKSETYSSAVPLVSLLNKLKAIS